MHFNGGEASLWLAEDNDFLSQLEDSIVI